MRQSGLRLLRFGAALCMAVFGSSAAYAQDAAQVDVSQLGSFIRWTGVATSLIVIAGAWVLLRLLAGFVSQFGTQFAARRLTMQKIATIAQFLIFIATAAIVLALSFRIDKTVLTLIGGTAAVAIGFAMKDLVASFIAGIIIIMDRPFQVGDRVSFDGFTVTSRLSACAPCACRRSTTTRSPSRTASS